MGNKNSGRNPMLCPHGILGKSKCKDCMRILRRQGKNYVNTNTSATSIKRCSICKTVVTKTINKQYICHDCFIKSNQERYAKLRVKRMDTLIKTLGKSCKVCDSEEAIIYHEIHGKPHRFLDAVKRPEDFVALCRSCHYWITRLYYTKNPEEAIRLIKLGCNH